MFNFRWLCVLYKKVATEWIQYTIGIDTLILETIPRVPLPRPPTRGATLPLCHIQQDNLLPLNSLIWHLCPWSRVFEYYPEQGILAIQMCWLPQQRFHFPQFL